MSSYFTSLTRLKTLPLYRDQIAYKYQYYYLFTTVKIIIYWIHCILLLLVIFPSQIPLLLTNTVYCDQLGKFTYYYINEDVIGFYIYNIVNVLGGPILVYLVSSCCLLDLFVRRFVFMFVFDSWIYSNFKTIFLYYKTFVLESTNIISLVKFLKLYIYHNIS